MSLVTLRVLPFANLAIPWKSLVAIQEASRVHVFVWWVRLGERAWSQHVQFLVLDGSVALHHCGLGLDLAAWQVSSVGFEYRQTLGLAA